MVQDGRAGDLFRHRSGPAGERVVVSYTDGKGVMWRVYERTRPALGRALVFESTNAVRLVREYPADWHTLPRAALEALSWCV